MKNFYEFLKSFAGEKIGIMRSGENDYWYATVRTVGEDYVSLKCDYHIVIVPFQAIDSVRVGYSQVNRNSDDEK